MKWLLRIVGLAESASPLLNPTVLYAIVGAFLLGSLSGAFATYKIMSWREGAALAEAAVKTIEVTHEQSAVTNDVEQKAAEQQIKIVTRYKTITKEVPVNVTAKADAQCVIPRGFVRVHDIAATGMPSVPGAAGEPNGGTSDADSPSGVSLSTVATTVAGNYGTYQQVVAQLLDLQAWVRRQHAVMPPQ